MHMPYQKLDSSNLPLRQGPAAPARRTFPARAKLFASVAALIMAGFEIANPAQAADLTQAMRFNIESKALAEALTDFSRQAEVIIVAPTALTAGKTSRAVGGHLTPIQALHALLDETGLQYSVGEDGAIVISGSAESGRRRGSAEVNTLGEVRVVGRLMDTLSMMKRGETMRETPLSITVVTKQRIEEQKLVSIGEVMEQVPGMTVERDFYNKPTLFYSRGFQVSNIQVDGVSAGVYSSSRTSRNLAAYEQVEVLRGADGLFAGSGDPGGTINLARKRALGHKQVLLGTSVGRWNNIQADLDVTGPLAFDGRLRGRAVAQWHDRDYFYDTAESNGWFFYATAEMDITDSTLLVLGGSLGKNDEVPMFSGAPHYTTGDVIPGWTRERSLMADWNTRKEDPSEIFARIEQKIGEDWRLTLSAASEKLDLYTLYIRNGNVDPITNLASLFTDGYTYASGTDSLDISVQGRFNVLGRTHSLLLGYDGYESGWTSDGFLSSWDNPPSMRVNPMDFRADTIPYPDSFTNSFREVMFIRQHGLYGRVQLHLAEPFKLILGGRYSSYESKVDVWDYRADGSIAATPDSSWSYKNNGIFTPYASALFDLNQQWTLYANVTEIYREQVDELTGPPPGSPLEAIRGRSYEIGSKGELRDGRLGVSAALYRIKQTGMAEEDPAYPYNPDNWRCCYIGLGDVVSQGVDTEISGEIRPGWLLSGGYTFNDNRNTRADAPFQSMAPKHTFKLWTSYRIPAAEQKWLVGGGMTMQSRRYFMGTIATYNEETQLYNGPRVPFDLLQGGYAVWNAMVQYRISPTWQLSLNMNNIFDKNYFSALHLPRGSKYGGPRNFMLTVRGNF